MPSSGGSAEIIDDYRRGLPPQDDLPKGANGGLRTPFKGESSSPEVTPPSDAPTYIGPPPPARQTPAPFSAASRTMSDSMFGGQPVLEPGHVLGQRYEILSLLGEGGMGAVYKARDIELNRIIALKTIRREYAGNSAIIERFKQELILSTQVTHRNVIRIYDLGEADGMKFITMEYVEGVDLRTLIHERRKLPAEEAVDIIQQACKALEAAHAVGVIHRDLKPQNIMRDPNGRILVMDFGLARTLEGDGMTQTGALVGTMEYMSPEQALGKPLDQRSDIFSLGLIFYELLTGQTPFRADSALASLIKRTQERAVPVSHHDSSISGPLDRIVNRCLERDVNLRYQTASELLADLNKWRGKTSSGSIGSCRAQLLQATPAIDPQTTLVDRRRSRSPPAHRRRGRLPGDSSLALQTVREIGRPPHPLPWRSPSCPSTTPPATRRTTGSARASPTCSAPTSASRHISAPCPPTACTRCSPICESSRKPTSIPTRCDASPKAATPTSSSPASTPASAIRSSSTAPSAI